jgi:quaternary ammonium compound-resistance protein SugE
MSWIILVIAGLLEVVWAIGLKYTHGFTRLMPSLITVTAMVVSIVLLSWAMRTLPVGTAYAVWTGIGAVGAAITGILLLGESAINFVTSNPCRVATSSICCFISLEMVGVRESIQR